jgi:TonB-dependent starch-binding outer membrane protein SusC
MMNNYAQWLPCAKQQATAKSNLIHRLLFAVFFLFSSGLYAQERTVSGRITDATDGSGIPGSSIVVKGTQKGMVTDANGNFKIAAASGATLVVSSVGYVTQEISVGNRTNIDISLSADQKSLDEIVVTGYGTQSKREITGAVTTVNAKDLQSVPATTFAQQLQGRASGLNIVNDATPGGNATVRIRGFGTIGNNDPLYIIDGIPTENQGNLNPNDIETIQILKDASSASIYGSRAANGVVIITTKRGKLGPAKISLSAYSGTQRVSEDVQALNAAELGKYLYLADKYAGKTPAHGQYSFGPSGEVSIPAYVFPSAGKEGADNTKANLYSLTPDNIYAITKAGDTNWWKEVTQVAPIKNFQLNASGGSENSSYALSAGYFSQDGVVKFIGYDRYTLRTNTEFSALAKKLRVGENFTVSLDNRKGGFGNNEEQNAVSGSYKHHPLLPLYDINGFFSGSRGANLGNNSNPYATLHRQQDNRRYRLRGFGNIFTEYDIQPSLTAKTSFGIDVTGENGRFIGRANPEYIEGSFNNSSSATTFYDYQWVWQNTLSYKKTFKNIHKIDAYVGVEAIKQFAEGFDASRSGYAFEVLPIISYLNLGDPTRVSNSGGVARDYTLWSQFGKFNYSFDDKYLIQAIVRNDASSRFLSASRNALFPALSFGWRLSEENFIKNSLTFVDDLKLRFGWGKTGNQKIGDYNAFTTYRSDIYHGGYPIDGNQTSPTIGYDASAFGNPQAKWEATTSTNFGLDAALLKNKLTFEFDVWNRVTTDMLFRVPLTFTAGDASNPAFNVGKMTNKGIDFGANYKDQSGSLTYSIAANISQYKNTVDKLDESPNTRYFGNTSRVPAVTLTQAGIPISSFFGYKVEGIFQNQEQVNGWPKYGDYNKVGKFKIADINGDKEITDADRTIIGNPHPDFTYGLNLNLGYKAFNLNAFANGSKGNDIFNYVRYFSDFNTFQGNRSKRALYDAWQPDNPSGTVPIMDANDQISSRPSSYFIEDGSYFRIKNIQLTYTLPSKIRGKVLDNAQVYVQGQNLATFTKYSGLNPEIQTGNDNTLGFDGGYMPVSRTIILGINFGF